MRTEASTWQKWRTALGITAGLALVLALSRRDLPAPTGQARIMDLATYQRDTENLAHIATPIFIAYDDGEEITEEQRAELRKCAQGFDTLSTFLPARAAPYLDAGRTYLILEDWETAEARLQQCLNNAKLPTGNDFALKPQGVADAKRLLSIVRLHQARWQDAYDLADQAVKSFPKVGEFYVTRASAEVQLKRVADARADIAKALELWPGNRRALQLEQLLETATGK